MQKVQAVLHQLPESTKMSTTVDRAAELLRAIKNNALSLPPRFREKTLKDFEGMETVVEKSKTAIEAGLSVFVTGSCGTGKTHLSTGLGYEWYINKIKISHDQNRDEYETDYPKPPIFLPSVEFFFELKAGFDSKTPEADIIEPYANAPLLILDDLGAEKVSDWSRQVCYLLIDRRYRFNRPMIITSNLSLDQLAKNIDDRIASRLMEMGIAVKLDGGDRRAHG